MSTYVYDGSTCPHRFLPESIGDTSCMTLRDYFAAKAMATIPQQTCNNMKDNESHEAYTARRAYAMADAMLEARK